MPHKTIASIALLASLAGCATVEPQQPVDLQFGGDGNDGSRALLVLPNDEFVLGGWQNMVGVHDTSEGFLIKTNLQGADIFQRPLITNGRNQVSALLQLDNGQILAALEEFNAVDDQGDVELVILSADGVVLKKSRIGGPGGDVADRIIRAPDGGFYVAGESASSEQGDKQAWIAKINSNLETVWDWRDGTPGRDRINDIVISSDGSVLAAGNATRPGRDGAHKEEVPWFVSLNQDGNVHWSTKLNLKMAASVRSIEIAQDGSMIFAGFARTPGQFKFYPWLGRISSEGKLGWQYSLDLPAGSYLQSVTSGSDGDYYAAGSVRSDSSGRDALIIKFSDDGASVQAHTMERSGDQQARVIAKHTSGQFVLAGVSSSPERPEDKQAWLAIEKLNGEQFSNVRFAPADVYLDSTYGDHGKDGLRTIAALSDGGFILAGWRDQTKPGHVGIGHIIKTASNGNVLWRKDLSSNGENRVSNVIERADGSLVLVVEEYPIESDPGQVVLVELASSGETLSQTSFGGDGPDLIEVMRPAPDGGFVFVGESAQSPHGDYQSWIGKLSSSLKLEWQHHLGADATPDVLQDVAVLSDGSTIGVGMLSEHSTDPQNPARPWMVKIDTMGRVLWAKTVPFEKLFALRGVAATPDDKLAVAGYVYNETTAEYDSWVGLMTADGEYVWGKTVKHPGYDQLTALEATPQNQYIAIGSAKAAEDGYDLLMVVFDQSGDQVLSYVHDKPGTQFGRAHRALENSDVAIGGFDLQDEPWGQQLWLMTMPVPVTD